MIFKKKDKKQHLLAGLALSLLAGLLFCPIGGLMAAVIVGLGKEVVWDGFLRRGTPEVMDFVATALGGLVAYLILIAVR